MILDTLENADRYLGLHPRFAAAFAFLRQPGLKSLPQGRHVIDGEELFAIVSKANGKSRDEARLECHRKYIDIQLVLDGTDTMGWKPTAECRSPVSDYSEEKDIRFFTDTTATWVTTPPGCFCLFFPEDAHAPLVSGGQIHKVVVKIAC